MIIIYTLEKFKDSKTDNNRNNIYRLQIFDIFEKFNKELNMRPIPVKKEQRRQLIYLVMPGFNLGGYSKNNKCPIGLRIDVENILVNSIEMYVNFGLVQSVSSMMKMMNFNKEFSYSFVLRKH